ncbi:MAG: porin [Pseudomonadota bacterium]|nr:porin [Pseudomonadota bacterium]
MLKVARRKEVRLLAALAVGSLLLSPAIASSARKRPPAVSISFDAISSFTPANADPKLAAALAGRGLSLNDMRFTPAPAKGRPSQLRVAIRARSNGPTTVASLAAPTVSALTPTSYNLGVAVGWRRFAVAGDVAKVSDSNSALGGRESAVLGVSYSLKRFTGRVAIGADRADGHPLPALRKGDNYSLDVGGAYALAKGVALTGGVRYQVERDRLSALQDERRDSQAVYVGTAVKF